jgi:hypothetical protein
MSCVLTWRPSRLFPWRPLRSCLPTSRVPQPCSGGWGKVCTDRASWYAQWLIDLSELPDVLGARPVRSQLICLLVSLDKHYTAEATGEMTSSGPASADR